MLVFGIDVPLIEIIFALAIIIFILMHYKKYRFYSHHHHNVMPVHMIPVMDIVVLMTCIQQEMECVISSKHVLQDIGKLIQVIVVRMEHLILVMAHVAILRF